MKMKKIKNYILTFIICLFGSFVVSNYVGAVPNNAYEDSSNVSVVVPNAKLDNQGNIISSNILAVTDINSNYSNSVGSMTYTADSGSGRLTLNGSFSGSLGGFNFNLPFPINTDSSKTYTFAFINKTGSCSSTASGNVWAIGLNSPLLSIRCDTSTNDYITYKGGSMSNLSLWVNIKGNTGSSGTTTFNNFSFQIAVFEGNWSGVTYYSRPGEILFYSSEGYNENEVYANGYDNGYSVGSTEGNRIGYNEGYEAGQTYAFDNGYQQGYNEGYINGTGEDNTLVGMVTAIIETPFNMFADIFNVNFLGVNLASFFFSIISVLIIYWLIRKLL